MKRLARIIVLISLGGRNGQFIILEGTSPVNLLGSFYWQLPMARKYTIFGSKLKSLLVRSHGQNYTYIFMERHIY